LIAMVALSSEGHEGPVYLTGGPFGPNLSSNER
jgi:hypothetical protein